MKFMVIGKRFGGEWLVEEFDKEEFAVMKAKKFADELGRGVVLTKYREFVSEVIEKKL